MRISNLAATAPWRWRIARDGVGLYAGVANSVTATPTSVVCSLAAAPCSITAL